MIKGQDIFVLAALLGRQDQPPTLSELSDQLGLSVSAVHRSLAALREANLVDSSRVVQFAQADEFFAHALRYLFPPRMSGESRGIPTASAASPLREQLAGQPAGMPPVWAHPLGKSRGIAFEPVHPHVPDAARRDEALGHRLALIDAFRLSDARIRGLARRELKHQFTQARNR